MGETTGVHILDRGTHRDKGSETQSSPAHLGEKIVKCLEKCGAEEGT